jgi:hypothetical protein
MPDQLGVAYTPSGLQRIDLIAGARELEHPELHERS